MQETHCPLCHGELETREVAPCHECGAIPEEKEHLAQGEHTYREYEVFPPLRLILCDFCDVDFGSYDPTFFGLPRGTRIGYQHFVPLEPVQHPALAHDKYCAACGHRLKFLRFVADARRQHAV